MQFEQSPWEVEIRFSFDTNREACDRIPFLDTCLRDRQPWQSNLYGKEVFESGRLLRIGTVYQNTVPLHYLCLKEADTGTFANIRREIEESFTAGLNDSIVLKYLGGKPVAASRKEIVAELERLGHRQFMSFSGVDTYGEYPPYSISVKLMECPQLNGLLLVEFEKLASSEKEAGQFEEDLRKITGELKLHDRRLKDEPPTLVYRSLFGTETG